MNRIGKDKLFMAFFVGSLLGFFIGYAMSFEESDQTQGSQPVAVAKGSVKPVKTKPMRSLEASPYKGSDSPKVIIHEISDFQ